MSPSTQLPCHETSQPEGTEVSPEKWAGVMRPASSHRLVNCGNEFSYIGKRMAEPSIPLSRCPPSGGEPQWDSSRVQAHLPFMAVCADVVDTTADNVREKNFAYPRDALRLATEN